LGFAECANQGFFLHCWLACCCNLQDKDFFIHLEMHMRQEHPPLAGRDHMAYRSAYFPVREVIDGDLCSQFSALPLAKQQAIAQELDRTPGEVLKKLEERRNAII
jgi:splicing factor 3B subunit 3